MSGSTLYGLPSLDLEDALIKKIGKTYSSENLGEFFSRICEPMKEIFSKLTPYDWLIIMKSYKYETKTAKIFVCSLIKYLPDRNGTCHTCILSLMKELFMYISSYIHNLLYETIMEFTEERIFEFIVIRDCRFGRCLYFKENSEFIGKLLDVIPEIFSQFYEYLLENIPTIETNISDLSKMWEYSSAFMSYDDYFCQKRSHEDFGVFFYRCGNKAVSEGGMCEKHMADPLTKPDRKS